jgi:hypothetical protein
VEKKLLNELFNFNLKQKKIVLNIQYEKRLKCFIRNEKNDINAFIPFIAKKGINTERTLKFHINDNSPNNDYCLSTNNNSIINFKKRKMGTLKSNKKNESENAISQNISNISDVINKGPIQIEQNIINRSKMIMLFKDDFKEEELNCCPINKNMRKNKLTHQINYTNEIDNNNKSNDLTLKKKEL